MNTNTSGLGIRTEWKGDDCPICYETMQKNDKVTLEARCGKVFHSACLDQSLAMDENCPNCRQFPEIWIKPCATTLIQGEYTERNYANGIYEEATYSDGEQVDRFSGTYWELAKPKIISSIKWAMPVALGILSIPYFSQRNDYYGLAAIGSLDVIAINIIKNTAGLTANYISTRYNAWKVTSKQAT